MTPDRKSNLHGTRKTALIALKVVGVALAVVAFSLGGLMMILQTQWGGERLRRQVVALVNRQIQGQLGIGRLSFGGDRIVVWDVTLRDPEGQSVARVTRAEIDFRLMRLLHEEIRLTTVVVESLHLGALSDPRGFNVSRAIAARVKTPDKPRTAREGWVVRLDHLDLGEGDVQLTSASATTHKDTVHFTDLQAFMSLRYATGNWSTDLTLEIGGQSVLAPVGPLAVTAGVRVRGDATHFTVDGNLLGGTLAARGDIDTQRLEAADALVAISIPQTALGGFDWGPVRVHARARPGAAPSLDVRLSAPGLELTAKGGGQDLFRMDGRLALADLALTTRALQALTVSPLPSTAGHGDLGFTIAGPMAGAPASWSAGAEGRFDHLRLAENAISGLSFDARVDHLSRAPGQADLQIAVGSMTAGTTKLGKIHLDAKVHQQDFFAEATLASPEPVTLALAGRLDDDQQGLALARLALSYPRAKWVSEGTSRLRFGGQRLSLTDLRLRSQAQELAVDGSKVGERIDGHLALTKLRLDLLPALVVDPEMNLGGALDIVVTAHGELSDLKAVARMSLEGGRFRRFSKIRATVDATLADQRIDGTLGVEAPVAAVEGSFHLPVNPLAADGPLNLRLDVTRLGLADTLRGAAMEPQADGRLTARLRVSGSAGSPKIALTINGHDLDVKRPASATTGPKTLDVGRARIHLTYADRAAQADIDFASAHGGTLRVDAAAGIDLSYPRVAQGIVVKKIPVHGKVVAKDLDVAWISRFNDRVEALGGQVSANAQLAGTVGAPQFIGDVRWKGGKVVATAAPKSTAHP